MEIHKKSSCSNCSKKEHCNLLVKIDQSVKKTFDGSRIVIRKTNSVDCYSVVSDSYKRFFITCKAIKKWSAVSIKKMITGLYDRLDSSMVVSNGKKLEVVSWDDLDYDLKIKKLSSILGINGPMKIRFDSKINARVNKKKEIIINTGALDELEFNEILFVIAHEEYHVNNIDNYFSAISDLSDEYKKESNDIIKSHQKFGKKFVKLLKLGLIGFGGYATVSQLEELSADIESKLLLRSLGLPDDAGEIFFSRINDGISFRHPSSSFRKYFLKNI